MLAFDASALFPSPRVPRREHAAKEIRRCIGGSCKLVSISGLSGSGIHVGSNWLEQQNVKKTTVNCCSNVPLCII